MDLGWGGTYSIKIGLCDERHVPVPIIGRDGVPQEQIEVGDVELGWGWGTPTMDQVRKPWSRVLNPLSRIPSGIMEGKAVSIGSDMPVNLDTSAPMIRELGDRRNDLSTRGLLPVLTIREFSMDRLMYSQDPSLQVRYTLRKGGACKADYKGEVLFAGNEIASFILRLEAIQKQVSLSLLDVKEAAGYELLEIAIPSILSLSGDDVEMVHFSAGGRLLSLSQAIPEGYSFKYDTRNAAALLKEGEKWVLESSCVDDRLNISILDNGKSKTANVGVTLVNKVRGQGRMASIPVEHDHKVKIDLLDNRWGDDGWQAVARFWRQGLKGVNRDVYRRALVYKQLSTSGPEPPVGSVKADSPYPVKRLTTVIPFRDVFDILKRNYHILDGIPQVLYVGGFQEGGFDNSYPYVFNTDNRLGSVEELRGYIQEAKKYNTILSLHDNYDSNVVTSKYYDPSCPASAEKSLQGKIKIIDEFNKYGVDITSETLLHPFVGHIGFGLHARTDLNAVFFRGERFIPLVDMVYHGTISYEGGGRTEQAMLMGLMKGSSIFISEEYITDDDIKWVYLHQMPVGLLYDKKIDRIAEGEGTTTVVYDDETVVTVNWEDKTYEVKVDGRIVAKDWTTFLPGFKENTYLAYSLRGGELVYDLPHEWKKATRGKAVMLTFEGEGKEIPCRIEGGKVILSMPTSTPVRVTAMD